MVDQEQNGYWIILLSFLVAAWLAVIPLPAWLLWARPEWPALVLIYWVIALPQRVSLLTGLLLGVYLDVLEGAALGQNGLSLTVVAYLSFILYQRLRVFNVLQQSFMVFVLVGINQLLCQWVQNLTAAGAETPMFLLPALTSALLWPAVLYTLRYLRRHYQVA